MKKVLTIKLKDTAELNHKVKIIFELKFIGWWNQAWWTHTDRQAQQELLRVRKKRAVLDSKGKMTFITLK